MALKHSGLCLFYEKVRNGPDTPHPLQFYFVTSFPVPPETKQHFSSTLSQGLHVPGKVFKSEDKSFRMNCLKH